MLARKRAAHIVFPLSRCLTKLTMRPATVVGTLLIGGRTHLIAPPAAVKLKTQFLKCRLMLVFS